MKIFTCKSFKGYWPVGTSAVIVAEDVNEAKKLLEQELADIGLTQAIPIAKIKELPTSNPKAIILNDGDY